MDNSLIINLENHRSRERIKDMGEVFTPEQYVQQMLGMFDEKIWTGFCRVYNNVWSSFIVLYYVFFSYSEEY